MKKLILLLILIPFVSFGQTNSEAMKKLQNSKELLEMGLITQKEFDQIEEKEKIAVEKAVDFARKSPFPAPEELYDDLFTDPIEYA